MKILGTNCRNETVEILITDCPVRINKDYLILAKCKNSLMIHNCSVRRADDDNTEEFSYVFDETCQFCGFVIYKNGFKIYNPYTKEISEISEKNSFMKNTNIKKMEQLSKLSDTILITVGADTFEFKQMIGYHGDDYLIYTFDGPMVVHIENEMEVSVHG